MSAIATLAAAPILAAITIDDLRHHRIRNHYVLALSTIAATLVLVASVDGDGTVIGRAALGAFVGSAPLAAVWITQPGGVGGGDVKLAAALGALIGTASPWLALAVTGIGLVVNLVAAVAMRTNRVAMAPAMAGAAILVVALHAAA